MIRDLKSLYAVIVENKVVVFETNLKLFVEKFNELEKESRNYDYYYRQFKKKETLEFENTNGVKYHLQKLL
ncbi:hypothetical protein [Psychroserpens sp. SPM9]|uniref:hypothetical protein n=1 Tax=Psychroserpens sp. SPM9 TaxID=2975598 RepID=UPI0021A521AA|nr:hypothetical protein [Psychroserpens sp. SPM9]MDG5490539.1 hypothetical protein [Psychroserpens sp. SPM9]